MKKIIKILLTVFASAVLMGVLAFSASAATQTTGNATWALSSSNTVLTISGSGAMGDYASSTVVPWNSYKSTIKTIVIGDGITSIGQYDFYGCTNVTSVQISDTVTSIGAYSFAFNNKLSIITIPKSVTNIGGAAFYGCTSLEILNFNAKRCEIAGSSSLPAFYNCTSLSNINFGSDVQIIPDYCFALVGITSINIPDNVRTIGEGAFYRCTNLKTVDMSYKTNSISERAFRECTSLVNFKLPELVTSIGAEAFYNCTSLKALDVSYHVVNIGADAFTGSAITVNTTTDAYAYNYCKLYGTPYNATTTSYGSSGGSSGSDIELKVNTNSTVNFLNGKMVIYVGFDETLTNECVHVAFYNSSDKVVDYMIIPIAKSMDNVYIVTNDISSASYAKVFIWDSLETCRPVSPVERVLINRP